MIEQMPPGTVWNERFWLYVRVTGFAYLSNWWKKFWVFLRVVISCLYIY